MKVKLKKVNDDAKVPKFATKGSAGFDLSAVYKVNLAPGETKAIPTGLCFQVEEGYEMQIRPRSGLTLNTPLRVHLGTVDSDFSGEVRVICTNTSNGAESIEINIGDRIAQGVINKIEQAEFELVEDLEETERGESGFGSSGL